MRRYFPFIFIICIIFLTICFLNWPSLSWSKVQFKYDNFNSKDAIKSICQEYFGKNIIFLSYSGILKNRLLDEFPTLNNVNITWSFPSKLTLDFTEKAPYFSFIVPSKSILVSQDGTILEKGNGNSEIENFDGVVMVRGITEASFSGTTVPSVIISNIDYIISAIRQYFPNLVFQLEFEQMKVTPIVLLGNLTLLKDDTLPIKIGPLEKLDEKFMNLHYYFKSNAQKNRDIDYIDLRVPKKVIVKYAQT